MSERRTRHRPLPPRSVFIGHLARNAAFAFSFIGLSLAGGALGYHHFEGLSWVDAILNAAMILTGMGPVSPLTSEAAKLFASGYALYSGVAFTTSIAVLLAPVAHRFLHKFHLDLTAPDDEP